VPKNLWAKMDETVVFWDGYFYGMRLFIAEDPISSVLSVSDGTTLVSPHIVVPNSQCHATGVLLQSNTHN